jgi:hypothetical protein
MIIMQVHLCLNQMLLLSECSKYQQNNEEHTANVGAAEEQPKKK